MRFAAFARIQVINSSGVLSLLSARGWVHRSLTYSASRRRMQVCPESSAAKIGAAINRETATTATTLFVSYTSSNRMMLTEN